MKKLTTGIFTVLLGLVAIDANAAITSKAYVDAKVSTEVGKVIDTAVSDKADKTQVATDIAAAVKVETDRATAAEQANANAIAANTTAVEQAQADATQALNESIKQIKATGEDGTYVLTIKTIGDQATLKWEQIERAEATQTPEA